MTAGLTVTASAPTRMSPSVASSAPPETSPTTMLVTLSLADCEPSVAAKVKTWRPGGQSALVARLAASAIAHDAGPDHAKLGEPAKPSTWPASGMGSPGATRWLTPASAKASEPDAWTDTTA